MFHAKRIVRAGIRTRDGSEGKPPGPFRVGGRSEPRVPKAQLKRVVLASSSTTLPGSREVFIV